MKGRLVALLALLAACPSKTVEPQTTPTGKRWKPNRLTHFDYLIWRGGDNPETVWVDRDGRELGRASGIVVALRGTVWKLRVAKDSTETYGCDQPPGRYQQTNLRLVGDSEDDYYDLAYYGYGNYGILEGTHEIEVLGEVGRYWFVTEHVVSTACDGKKQDASRGIVFDMVSSNWYDSLTPDEEDYNRENRPVWKDGAFTLEQKRDAAASWRRVQMSNALEDEADFPEKVRERLSALEGPAGVSYGLPDARWKRMFGQAEPSKEIAK